MPPKQRQIRIQQQGGLAAMQQLETRSDEELEREQKFKAAAQAILGARAAERYDAKASREHFRRALAAARPPERLAPRRPAHPPLAPGGAPRRWRCPRAAPATSRPPSSASARRRPPRASC